jgi:phosphoglycerate dehydrogenase-like enzyme
VNTARETLVDEAALDAALGSGHLAGAALDVVHASTRAGRHPLLRHENVVIHLTSVATPARLSSEEPR